MHDFTVLMTFVGGLAGALVFGYLATRLKLSPIVGYLLAGIAVGPFTPGYVADREIAAKFADIGVILLLFGIGLRFHLRELIAVWRVAVPGALIQSSLSTLMMAAMLHLMGWSWAAGLILGAAISVASTVVMSMVLGENHDLHASIGYIAVGWTVVEDLLTVGLLILLPAFFGREAAEGVNVGASLGIAVLKVGGLGAVVVVLGRWVIPRLLERIEESRVHELFTLAVLVLAVGIAVGSARFFGVSMELGAFLAGLAVGRSEFAARAAIDALPMRDAFAVLFFVAVGMLFEPRSLLQNPLLIAAVLFVVMIGKPLIAMATVRALGTPMATAVPVGAAFSQVGEFSFILGTVARQLEVIDDTGWNALVAVSILSISLNPSVYRWARGLAARTGKLPPVPEEQRVEIDPNRSILVGYGPIGKIVHRLLADQGVVVAVIDLNLKTVRRLRSEGHAAVYGDVLRPGTLVEAGISTAGSLILSANIEDAAEVIRQARTLNPELQVFARCTYLRDVPELRRAGADLVASGEAEVGVVMAEAAASLRRDKADPVAKAERRDAVRKRLYDGSP